MQSFKQQLDEWLDSKGLMPSSGPRLSKLTRRPDWRQRLSNNLIEVLPYGFGWASNDCLSFASMGVGSVVKGDLDLYSMWTQEYDSALGAARALRNEDSTWATPADLLCYLFNETPVNRAQRGDLVIGSERDGWAVGICDGETYYAVAEEGLGRGVTLDCIRAFRVGY